MAEAYCWESEVGFTLILALSHSKGEGIAPSPQWEGDERCGMLPAWSLRVSGCAEGRSPFAEGLGVLPNLVISPKSGGSRGLKEASNRAIMNIR